MFVRAAVEEADFGRTVGVTCGCGHDCSQKPKGSGEDVVGLVGGEENVSSKLFGLANFTFPFPFG